MSLSDLLSTSEVFAQIISFLVLLALLRIFAWKPMLKLLDKRREKIASDLKQIEHAKFQVDALKEEYEHKLKTIDEAARARIQEVVAEGWKIAGQIQEDANQQARKTIENARENVAYELVKAREELKESIIDIVLKATTHVVQERLTEQDDRKIVENFIEKIGEDK